MEVRVFNDNKTKLLYTFTMNKEIEEELFEKMVFLGLDSPKTKEDTLNRYFDLIAKSKENYVIEEDPSFKINDKSSLVRAKTLLIAELKQRLKYKKLTKVDARLLVLSILLCAEMLALYKVKESIDITNSHQDMRQEYITMTKTKLLDKGIAEEVIIGHKGDPVLREDTDYSNMTYGDVTPLEVFGFISFVEDMYEDVNTQNAFINSYIQNQTYNNGNDHYQSFDEYLKINGFDSEKDFIEYCYNSDNDISIIRTRHY